MTNEEIEAKIALDQLGGNSSKELNEKISAICDEPDKIGFEAFGGKVVPYIGWYWREVDFDEKEYAFGVTDDGEVGFMENNKWDYGYVNANPAHWLKIKTALIRALASLDPKDFEKVNTLIQSLRRTK